MNKLKTIWSGLLLVATGLSLNVTVYGQCSFSGLDPTYCESDDHVTLIGDPTGGVFSGPGMVGGETFDPSVAGPGVHTITYEMAGGGTGDKYYIKSNIGDPWGGANNQNRMDAAFGGGDWTLAEFETLDAATVFSPTTGFVFIDGSDGQASELATFLATNLATIEAWVFDGGRLLLNSAPNEGGDIDFGFDGTTLNYAPVGAGTHVNDVTVVDAAHPALLGPGLPTSTAMSGTYYGHSLITGTGLTTVLTQTGDATKVVLAEKCWGSGRVMFGGMTTHNFHSPGVEAGNWRANLLVYLYENACGGGCTYTQEVEVFAAPDVTLTADKIEICEGEDVVFTASGADTYSFDVGGVTEGVPYTPVSLGTTTYTVTGIDDVSGCSNFASVDVTVNALPTVTATADDLEVCFGDNLTLTGGGADTYVWDMGVIDGLPFTPGPIGTITYNVTGTDINGCENTTSITVDVIDCEPVFAGFTFDNNICAGDCITFTDTSVGTTITTWEWDFGGAVDPGTSSEPSPTLCFDNVGEYNISLTITSLYGQVSTATHTLTVNEIPVVNTELDTIITLGGKADLIATSTHEGTYTWTPEDGIDCPDFGITTASPLDSTMYNVFFIDENGCTDQGSVMVLVNFIKGVGVPSAFSPNGDGVNDVLYVKGLGIEAIHFVIYNRYGEVVFESSDQNIGWDGTFKNKPENPGVFTWVLHYDFYTGDKGMQKGNTTLMR